MAPFTASTSPVTLSPVNNKLRPNPASQRGSSSTEGFSGTDTCGLGASDNAVSNGNSSCVEGGLTVGGVGGGAGAAGSLCGRFFAKGASAFTCGSGGGCLYTVPFGTVISTEWFPSHTRLNPQRNRRPRALVNEWHVVWMCPLSTCLRTEPGIEHLECASLTGCNSASHASRYRVDLETFLLHQPTLPGIQIHRGERRQRRQRRGVREGWRECRQHRGVHTCRYGRHQTLRRRIRIDETLLRQSGTVISDELRRRCCRDLLGLGRRRRRPEVLE